VSPGSSCTELAKGLEDPHAYMAAEMFHRTITGDDGREYQLPTAAYCSYGDLMAVDVRA